jgi:hypothetical protein
MSEIVIHPAPKESVVNVVIEHHMTPSKYTETIHKCKVSITNEMHLSTVWEVAIADAIKHLPESNIPTDVLKYKLELKDNILSIAHWFSKFYTDGYTIWLKCKTPADKKLIFIPADGHITFSYSG